MRENTRTASTKAELEVGAATREQPLGELQEVLHIGLQPFPDLGRLHLLFRLYTEA